MRRSIIERRILESYKIVFDDMEEMLNYVRDSRLNLDRSLIINRKDLTIFYQRWTKEEIKDETKG